MILEIAYIRIPAGQNDAFAEAITRGLTNSPPTVEHFELVTRSS